VSGYPQPPPMSHMAVAAAYAQQQQQQQHVGMQGAAAYPAGVPPGFAFAAHAGFPAAGPYGYPAGAPPPPPPPQQQQQPPQPQMPNYAGAFGPAAQLFSMHQQQQQGFGAPPTRPPGFGTTPLPGPPPGLRAGFAPGPPPHAVMGMYAPHTVYATAQPVGAYYSSR
jgi:ABC-2 type transport system ATP-binding protein